MIYKVNDITTIARTGEKQIQESTEEKGFLKILLSELRKRNMYFGDLKGMSEIQSPDYAKL